MKNNLATNEQGYKEKVKKLEIDIKVKEIEHKKNEDNIRDIINEKEIINNDLNLKINELTNKIDSIENSFEKEKEKM